MTTNPFVSTAWLAAHLKDENLVVVDGSWYLPAAKRDARAEYLAGHVPGAVWFDVDQYADLSIPLPHMLMRPDAFGELAGRLGIGEQMTIVVYDGAGLFSAPRVRWTFETMGARHVVILEGGLPKWLAEGRPVEAGEPARQPATFRVAFKADAVADVRQMQEFAHRRTRQIADARPAGRFSGRGGGATTGAEIGTHAERQSAPADQLVADGVLKPVEVLRAQFAAAGIDLSKPIATTCGSGVTAATLKLALEQAGATDVVLYDGSWAEWGGRDDVEVVTG